MHIVYVSNELNNCNGPQGGLGSFVANMARIFHHNGHEIEIVLVTTKETPTDFDEGINVTNVFVEKEKWEEYDALSKEKYPNDVIQSKEYRLEMLEAYKAKLVRDLLYECHIKKPIDLIHFANHGAFSRFMDRTIPYIIRISGFLNIISGSGNTRNGSLDYQSNPLSKRDVIEIQEIMRSRYIISPSRLLADILYDNWHINATVLESPYLLSKDKWDKSVLETRLIGRKYVLYYSSSCSYLKGIQVIADLAEPFLAKHKDYCLVLCGKDCEIEDDHGEKVMSSEYVEQKAGQYKDRFMYLGILLRTQLYPIIENADICILPSRIENFSNACVEAMALGRIVVATRGASYEQLIEDGVSGYLCERDNAKSFLLGIENVLNCDCQIREKMKEKAKERTWELSPDKTYYKFLQYYENVIKEWTGRD